MRWLRRDSHVVSVVGGMVAGGVAVAVTWIFTGSKQDDNNNNNNNPFRAWASWTTNSQPSVKWDNNWDRRDPESATKPKKASEDDVEYEKRLAQAKPTATRHLLLIRHGQYNLAGITDSERKLTLLGQEQAEITGKRLQEINYPWTKIISSTMKRAIETADIIQTFLPSDLPREYCEFLREGAPIPPEPPIGHWRPEAQQFYEDGSRIEAAFCKYFHRASPDQLQDSYEVVVCHANVIRYFVCRALQFPPEAWLRMSLNHGSLTHMAIRPSGRVSIKSLSEAGHMPVDKISST